jgi:hypothetical protein
MSRKAILQSPKADSTHKGELVNRLRSISFGAYIRVLYPEA